MGPKKDLGKGKQPSIEPEDESIGEGSSGETSRELVPPPGNTIESSPFVPGFSTQQVSSLAALFHGMLNNEWDRRFDQLSAEWDRRFEQMTSQIRLQIDPFSPSQHANQLSNQPSSQQLTPQLPTRSPPVQAVITTTKSEIRAEEVGFFDPEYQQEQGTTQGQVVNAGKHVYYRDVYLFVNRLKDLANYRDGVKHIVTVCLRGSALMWYSAELTDLERDLLRDAQLDHWYTTLINRFKIRTSVALSQLTYRSYGMQDLRNNVNPRAFVMEMLHLAKAAEFTSPFNQIIMIWNRFHVSLRQHIPEPTKTTSLGQFLDQIDSKTAIWYEMAHRPTYQSQQSQQSVGQQQQQSRGQQQPSHRGQQQQMRPFKARAHLVDPEDYYDEEELGEQEHAENV